jgi:hypothetical protein
MKTQIEPQIQIKKEKKKINFNENLLKLNYENEIPI